MNRLRNYPLLILALACCSMAYGAQPRHALVIGNAEYQHATPLVNTLNDARDISADLRATGFQVTEVSNADLNRLIDAIDRFVALLRDKGGVGLLYYSGHGVQVDGQNYLVPVDARLKRKSRIKYEAYALDDALSRMGGRGADSINLVILDACRNNPFASTRSMGSKGLARVEAPESTLILYAAKPGQTASDNPRGRNGLFTKHLRQAIRNPGVNVENAFSDVVKKVYQESGRDQYPWKEGVLLHPFAFAPRGQTDSPPPPVGRQTGPDPEILFWESVEESGDPAMYRAYLNKYPSGVFAELAQLKIRASESIPSPPAAAHPNPQQAVPEPVTSKAAAPYRRSLVKRIRASSSLASQKDSRGSRHTYGPTNVMDGEPLTAWVEGAKGHGLGEWLEVTFKEIVRIRGIGIDGEYKGNKNNRLKQIGISLSEGDKVEVELEDTKDTQWLQLANPVDTNRIRFTVLDVYRGTRFADTPISEITFE